MSYFESRLKVDFGNLTELEKKLKLCERLGIKNIILEPCCEVKKIKQEIKQKIKEITSINVYYRINLLVETIKDFKNKIKFYNNCLEIISIESSNPEVHILAARDSRVDLISFANIKLIKSLSKGILSLVKQNNSFIEFTLTPIMDRNKSYQSKAIRNLFRALQLVLNSKSNYIISGNFSNLYDLRHPRALVSICNTLIGISLSEAKKAFSDNVLCLINRAQNRHDKYLFEEGVRLIKGD
ncbi:MAG: hypothetical protein KGD57_02650 [Candidatus Lokiarchaeota archaeon]|nr:hypothetical protein [Candidatus Lokiarchaeota archaeon]